MCCTTGESEGQTSIVDTNRQDARSARLEGMMITLDNRIDELLVKAVVKSCAQVAKTNTSNKPVPTGLIMGDQEIPVLERQTGKILNEYTDRERSKTNIIIHLPESTKEQSAHNKIMI